ncbi:SGNH/GDSL hydrolase family protein [Robertmurraya korlensis]|uniref:SGNH/GDSL hydrolase family protein n=1 Tax=Robertmurraya korlensis TaxID=519977 RepID=UPI0008269A6E|nr:SGNH/GDSL hydrolase family protein [Robertmurraya korlensis]
MRAFFTTLIAIVCLVLLIFGNLHWQKKIEVTGSGQQTTFSEEELEAFVSVDPVLDFTSNWSELEKEYFQTALSEKRPYHILIAGSEQLGEGESSWPTLFQKEMLDTYGENIISIESRTYPETTAEFVEAGKQTDLITSQADLIIWEPFILSDNAVVPMKATLANITTVMNEVKEANPNTIFILQPPNPLYQPKLYKTQVAELKAFAEEHQIPYLDHWTSWPDPMSEQIRDYLDEDNQPNEEGHQVWANYLLGRFISQ